MIQDIFPKIINNAYKAVEIESKDTVILFQERHVLVQRKENDSLYLPSFKEVEHLYGKEETQFVFEIDETRYFLIKTWMKSTENITGNIEKSLSTYKWEPVRSLRQLISKDICFAVMTAFHLVQWYQSHQYCGKCGKELQHDTKERMLLCPHCNNMVYPTIAPAVIVALTKGDKILMTKYADREYKRYALLAGFTEIGETAEETVAREVMEEVGLRVKNIRYYKSQPWGVDSNLLLGFFAELDGEDDIVLDENELALAEWHARDNLPAHDDGISLTREMLGAFERGE